MDLRLSDTAYINEVIFSGGGSYGAAPDNIFGNGQVYIDYVETHWVALIEHSEDPTTTDLIHIDTTIMFGGGINIVSNCECNYTKIHDVGRVHSGLYNIVIIHKEGEIFNGYFNDVWIGDNAQLYSTSVNGACDYEGTFIGYAELMEDGYFHQENLTYPCNLIR
ncbi:MAG: hypothetical protein HC803_00670 [Saprospiraceae bacterium]|nr:hypothetical protein [Saprospiraceae bacterium]